MNAESIAHALGGRKSGAGWMARCPAHEDHSPSLSIRETDGKLLVHCHASCAQQAVIEALRARGLWPQCERTWRPGAPRPITARQRAEARPLARQALWWVRERLEQLEELKAATYTAGGCDLDKLRAAAREHHRLQRLTPEGVLAEYLRAKTQEPRETVRLTRLGQTWQNACVAAVRAILAKIQREQGTEARRAA